MTEEEEMHLFVESDTEALNGMKFFLVPKRYRWATNDEQVKIEDVVVTYGLPNDLTQDQIRLKAVETLREKQERVIAEAQKQKVFLQEKIDNLLLLTHQQ